MNLQVLVATMHQNDHSILEKMNIQSDAIVVNQCDRNHFENFEYHRNQIRFLSLAERGVGLSRNNALMRATAEICLFSDDDVTYVDGYRDLVLNAFKKHRDAGLIVFNVPSTNPQRQPETTKRNHRVRWFNSLRYGTYRMAIKTETIRRQNVYFSLLYGGGARFGSGEDSLFIFDCLKKRIKVYADTSVIGYVSQENSTWFEGHTEKYFTDKGALYHSLSGKWCTLLCLQYTLRRKSTFKSEMNWFKAFKLMMRGAKDMKK